MASDALKAAIAQRLVAKRRGELAWADVTGAVAGAGAAQKAALLDAIKAGNARVLGEALIAIVLAKVSADAQTEAASMLADDAVSAADLERIL
jgi:hypothetical protein